MRPPSCVFVAEASRVCLVSIRADNFTVTTANALGPGSLYEAINSANTHPRPDTIDFSIPGTGQDTIVVGDNGLPEINDLLTIDGDTLGGHSA